MCTAISPHLTEPALRDIAEKLAVLQNAGVLDRYFEKAREICKAQGVPVCDLYAAWKAMETGGVNVTELLSNKINHPTRKYHNCVAVKLLETMLEIK